MNLGRLDSGGSSSDVRNSSVSAIWARKWVSVVTVWVSVVTVRVGVRRGDVLDSGEGCGVGSSGVSGSGEAGSREAIVGVSGSCWVAGVGEGTDSVEGSGSVLVPRWIDSMDAEVLLSSFLILGLILGDDASGQSHQNQKALK